MEVVRDGDRGYLAQLAACFETTSLLTQRAWRHAYSVPACWFFSTAVIMRVAVVL
jgi:hypothetical protein